MAIAGRAEPGEPVAVGTARVDRRTKNLVRRLHPGEVAIIDHEDLDRVAAEALIYCRVGAVVNAAASISGRYPNEGPLLLAAARVPILDSVGVGVLDAVHEGQTVRIDGDSVFIGDR